MHVALCGQKSQSIKYKQRLGEHPQTILSHMYTGCGRMRPEQPLAKSGTHLYSCISH